MTNPYKLWKRYHISSLDDLRKMVQLFEQDQPKSAGFDTETDGLHIIYSRPFLLQFGWLVPGKNYGRVFTMDTTRENVKTFFYLAKRVKYLLAHNIKFDLHMLTNIGYAEEVLSMTNLYDNMAVARLALEAVPARDGGDSLDLKSLGVRYVHPTAGDSEAILKAEKQKLNNERIKILAAALRQFPLEGEKTATGRQKYWGKGVIESFLKDITHDVNDLPPHIREVWLTWQEEYPEPTYADIDRNILIRYGADDVITMMEFFKKAFPIILERKQLPVLERESRAVLPLFKMERVGLKIDREYLENCRKKVKAYIIKLRNEMYRICGEKVTVGQHKRIIEVFNKKWNIMLENANKQTLQDIQENFDGEPKRLAQIIQELRSLEKWYSTYIVRLLDSSKHDGRAYTQLNAYGAVSGRMSSDFQQFPRDPLVDEEGNELFHPRKAFLADYLTAYIDYSQIELRVQADYTLKVSGGDLNMCRAYMPFRCHRIGENGEKIPYEFDTPEKRKEWNKYTWFLDENPKQKWTPTDNHNLTAHNALLALGYECIEPYKEYRYNGSGQPFFKEYIDEDEFKRVRSKGKSFNFMKNYGGGIGAAMKQLGLPRNVAQALIDGFTKAFPHVIIYQQAVDQQHAKKGYVQNMYGRRYYLRDRNKAYKLANYLIQGTCADALKEAIIRIDEYITKMNLKTRMILPIHDELQFKVESGEEWAIYEFQRIMQEVFDEWCLVPVVAEIETSKTCWAEAKEGIITM